MQNMPLKMQVHKMAKNRCAVVTMNPIGPLTLMPLALLSGCYLLVGWPFECDGEQEVEECSCHLRRKMAPVEPTMEESTGGSTEEASAVVKKHPTEESPLVSA